MIDAIDVPSGSRPDAAEIAARIAAECPWWCDDNPQPDGHVLVSDSTGVLCVHLGTLLDGESNAGVTLVQGQRFDGSETTAISAHAGDWPLAEGGDDAANASECPQWCFDHYPGTAADLHLSAREVIRTRDGDTMAVAAEKYSDEAGGTVSLVAGCEPFELTHDEAVRLAFNLLAAAGKVDPQ